MKKKQLLTAVVLVLFYTTAIAFAELEQKDEDKEDDIGKCQACDYIGWISEVCDPNNLKQLCAMDPNTPVNDTGMDSKVTCPVGEILDDYSMVCKKAPLDRYLDFIMKKIKHVRARSQPEIAAKTKFMNDVNALLEKVKTEKVSSDKRLKEKIKILITALQEKASMKALKAKCEKNPSDPVKRDLCGILKKLDEHLGRLTSGNVASECGAEQAFDFSALKCVDKELADMGLEILKKVTSEKADDSSVDTIQKSLDTSLSELLNLFKTNGYTDGNILDSLKKQSVSIAITLKSLCTGDDEKAPYCKLVEKVTLWFDQVVYEKSPCKNGQIFDVNMDRKELQCLDLDFVSFMKKLVNGYMAEVDPEAPKELTEFQKQVVTLLDTSMTAYEAASNTDARTTSQRQLDFLKAFKTNIMNFGKTINKVCPEGDGLEIKACKMATGVVRHVGMVINDVESCPHQQIFDFKEFQCVDVIFVDFAKSALQEIDKMINGTTEEGEMFVKVKQSLDLVMDSFKTQTTKAGADTTTQRFAEFEKILRAEAKKVIDVFLPKCEVHNKTHPSVEDNGCIMLQNVFGHYKKLLDNIGGTKCPLGQIFDEEGLACVDMHVVEYAQQVLDYFQKEIDHEKAEDERTKDPNDDSKSETKIEEKLVKTLKAFITKVKVVAKTSDTSAVKLEKVKTHGEEEMKAMVSSLNEYCGPAIDDPMCPKALVLGQHVVGFLFNNLFTEGCGLDEIFDLSILKCVDAKLYDSLKDVFRSIAKIKPESETSKVVQDSMAAVLVKLVDHIQKQATTPNAPIDIFVTLLDTVKDEIKTIIKMTDTLCADALKEENKEDKIEHNINFAMCYMVKNVTRHFEMIAEGNWDQGDVSCGASGHWQSSILDCVDIHFVVFVEQIMHQVGKLDSSLNSTSNIAGRMLHMMKKVFNIYKKGDQVGRGHEELMRDFLRNARDEAAVVMRQMQMICKDLSESGTEEETICEAITRMAGNFGANIVGETKNGRSCKEGQLVDVEMLKCVDVAFMDMAQKMMTMLQNNFGEHMGSMDNDTMKSMHHFIDTLMIESRRDVPVTERQQNLMVFILQQGQDMMSLMGDHCISESDSKSPSFEHQLCTLVGKLGSTMTKAMMYTTGKSFDEFVESVLVSLKFLKQSDADVTALSSLMKQLKQDSMAAKDKEQVLSGGKYKLALEEARGKIKPMADAVGTMCQDDEKADICKILKHELENFSTFVSQRCESEGEVFDYKTMQCRSMETPTDLFDNTLEQIKAITIADNANAADLKAKWIEHITKLKSIDLAKISKIEANNLLNEFKKVFKQHDDFCAAVMKMDSLKRDLPSEGLCRLGNNFKKTLEKMMDSEDGQDAKHLCSFVYEKSKIQRCQSSEKFCAIKGMCIHKHRDCLPDDSSFMKVKMTAGKACEKLNDVCSKSHDMMHLKNVCGGSKNSAIFKDVVIKSDLTIGTLVSIALLEANEVFTSLDFDESSLVDKVKDQWEWICADPKKIADCRIKPKTRVVGSCLMRPVLLKGLTRSNRQFYVRLVDAHSQYGPPRQEKIKAMAVKKITLYKKDEDKEEKPKMQTIYFRTPPSRDMCKPMAGFKPCKELAVHVVKCRGEPQAQFIVHIDSRNKKSFTCGDIMKRKYHIPEVINIEFKPFSGSTKGAMLDFAYTCVDDKQSNPNLADPIVITKDSITTMEFNVDLPPPTFRKNVVYAPPVPVFANKNLGFVVKDLFVNDPMKYSFGKAVIENAKEGGFEILSKTAVEDVDKMSDAGGVMYDVKTSGHGKFQYQCGNNPFKDISIPKSQHMLLPQDCKIKFVPSKDENNWVADKDRNWADGEVSFKGRICSNASSFNVGVQRLELNNTELFGDRSAEIRILRAGCKGKIGGKIEKKCDNVLCSDAELQCDVCVGGSSQVKENPKYFMGKCCKKTWCRGHCQDDGDIVDCDGKVCGNAYLFAPCKQCMKGTKEEIKTQIRRAFDDCQQCKNAANKQTCGADTMIVKPIKLQTAPANLFTVCMSKDIKELKCKLTSETGTCQLSSEHPEEFKKNRCPQGISRDDGKRQCIKRFAKACAAGTYTMECTHTDGKKYSVEKIVIEAVPTLASVSPATIKPGYNDLDITLTGFNPLHMYRCCRKLNDDVACMPSFSQISDDGKMKCHFMLDDALSVKDKFEGYIESCLGSATNKKALTYACVEPVVKAIKLMKNKLRIHFEKPSVKSSNAACNKFRFVNSLKWEAKLSDVSSMMAGNLLKIPKVCLSCDPSATGAVDFPLDVPSCLKPHKDLTISTCDKKGVVLRPVKGFMHNVDWSVTFADGKSGDVSYLQSLNEMLKGKRFIKFSGSLLRADQPMLEVHFNGSSDMIGHCKNSSMINVTQEQSGYKAELVRSAMKNGKEIYRVKMHNACGKRSSFKAITWNVFFNGVKQTDFEDMKSKQLFINKFYGYDVNREILVSALVTAPDDSMVETKVDAFVLKAKELGLKLNRGKSEMYVACTKRSALIRSQLAGIREKTDQYTWRCEENGQACLNKLGEVMTFENARNLKIDPSLLLCGKRYTFILSFLRKLANNEAHNVEAKVDVSTRNDLPPKMNCVKRSRVDDYIIKCVAKGTSNITIENIAGEGDAVDFDSTKLDIVWKKSENNDKVIIVTATIQKEFLTSFSSYSFRAKCDNENGESIRVVQIKTAGPPANCHFKIEPDTGIVYNTTFSLNVAGCEIGNDATIMYSAILDFGDKDGSKDVRKTSVTADNKIFERKLRQSNRLDNKITIIAMATANKETFKQELIITVNKSDTLDSKSIMADAVKEAEEMMENGDSNTFLDILTDATAVAKIDENADASAIEAFETENSQKCVEASSTEGVDKDLVAQCIRVCTEKEKGNDSPAANGKKESVKAYGVSLGVTTNDQNSQQARRKRRSIGDENEDTITWSSEDEVESFITSNNGVLFPIAYTTTDQDAKSVFLAGIPNMQRSLSKLWVKDDFSVTTENIHLSTQRVTTISKELSMTSSMGNMVVFDHALKDKYEFWQCSEAEDWCNGLFIAYSEVNGDLLSNQTSESKTLVTPVMNLNLINPLADGNFVLVKDSNLTANVTLKLKENTTDVYCHVWAKNQWSVDGCTTVAVESDSVTCHCKPFVGHYVAGFKVSDVYKFTIDMKYTTTPEPTTTVSTVTATGSSTNQGGSVTVSTPVKFSFDVNYDHVISKYGTYENARSEICTDVRYGLGLKTSEFENCTISNGSVVVSFVVKQSSSDTSSTLTLLDKKVKESSFTTTLPGESTPMQTKKDSVVVNGVQQTTPTKTKEDDDKMLYIIAGAVGGLVVLIVVIVLFVVCCKKKSNQKVIPSPKGSSPYPTRLNNEMSPTHVVVSPRSPPEGYNPNNGMPPVDGAGMRQGIHNPVYQNGY